MLLTLFRNDVVQNGETALMRASEYGRIDIVKLLLEAGANPEKKDNVRQYALYYVIVQKNAYAYTIATEM